MSGAAWAIIILAVRAKGRRQVAKYGTVPAAFGREPAELEGPGHYVGTRVDGGRCYAKGYWARSVAWVRLTAHALQVQRVGVAHPMLVPREGIRKVDPCPPTAARGFLSNCVTVIHWEMGGGRFETGIVFSGEDDDRRTWERRLVEPRG